MSPFFFVEIGKSKVTS